MTWGYLLSISMDAQKFQGQIDIYDVYIKASFPEIVYKWKSIFWDFFFINDSVFLFSL